MNHRRLTRIPRHPPVAARPAFLLFAVLLASMTPALATAAPSLGTSDNEFAQRRERVLEAMREAGETGEGGEDALLLLVAPRPDHFAGDVDYLYRTDDDLYYLTGMSEPDFALLLSARALPEPLGHAVLFHKPQRSSARTWVGERVDEEGASRISGIPRTSIRERSALDDMLRELLGGSGRRFRAAKSRPRRPFYFDTGARFAPGQQPTAAYRFLLEKLGSAAFVLNLQPPRRLTHPLRQVKSPAELAALRKAIDVTCKALRRAMQTARPGLYEYELRATIEGTFMANGCDSWGFPSIVGTGPNTCILHYQRYDRKSRPGELLLMDVGAEYGFYSADVTRTIPLDGRFSERQRQIYAIVLAVQKVCIAAVKPGTTMDAIGRIARQETAKRLVAIGLIDKESEVRRYLPHGVSHGIGLNVHDPMPLRELAPGMVITIEPGVYIAEENIGIRIEDDVLVTEEGCEVLSAAAPKEIEAIESLMNFRSF